MEKKEKRKKQIEKIFEVEGYYLVSEYGITDVMTTANEYENYEDLRSDLKLLYFEYDQIENGE
jgi:hypothetical protein